MKRILKSDKSPQPIGPYSQAVGFENFIYTSGQVGLGLDGKLVSEDVKEQTKKAFENLKNILNDNGFSFDDVVKTTVFLKDMNDFTPMNEAYKEFFTDSFPARSTFAVAGLPLNAKVEIEVIAYKK